MSEQLMGTACSPPNLCSDLTADSPLVQSSVSTVSPLVAGNNILDQATMEGYNGLYADQYPGNDTNLDNEVRFNFSYNMLQEIIYMSKMKRYLSPTAEIIFVMFYVVVILAGVIGNVMVGYVIWRKKTMRTPRNLYIINLTFSDLSMCVFCMPFTLVQLLNKDFNLGSFICKLIHVIQCTNIMVSISTIVAIAADRYAAIVVGMSERSHCYVGWSIGAIWLVSLAFTLPLFSWYDVVPVRLHKIVLYRRCMIIWPSEAMKYMYVVTLLIMMYVLPIIVLSTVHAAIRRYLGNHIMNQHDSRRAQREIDRNRKTTMLLTAIAVAFAVSWLPLQIANMLADFDYSGFHDPQTLYSVIGSCHLIAMSTACTNPILYGWLNTNLRRELLEFLPSLARTLGLRRSWSLENTTKQDQGESPTRGVESVTYSTVVFHAKNSPRVHTRTGSPVSPLMGLSNPSSRKHSRRSTPSPTGQATLLTLMPRSPTVTESPVRRFDLTEVVTINRVEGYNGNVL